MEKKSQSKPMKEIIEKIECEMIKVIVFKEETIFNQDVVHWPIVDALICFYSEGFPLLKAQDYVKVYKPFLINDLKKQEMLWDRMQVYQLLREAHILTYKHFFVTRDHERSILNKCNRVFLLRAARREQIFERNQN